MYSPLLEMVSDSPFEGALASYLRLWRVEILRRTPSGHHAPRVLFYRDTPGVHRRYYHPDNTDPGSTPVPGKSGSDSVPVTHFGKRTHARRTSTPKVFDHSAQRGGGGSEDIGMADPMALVVADAAARAVEFVGLPEAQLNLAQAVVHLATAPKSNRTALGIWRALEDVRTQPAGSVPAHLRDSHYKSAKRIGHGVGYQYPHDDPDGWVEQDYLPESLAGAHYYEPSGHGHEAEIADRQRRHRDPR